MTQVFRFLLVLVCMAFLPAAAQIGPQAIGVTAKRAVLKTFTDADGRQKGEPIPVALIAFPLVIYEKSLSGLVRSKVNGADVWLDPDQLLMAQSVQANCLVVKNQSNVTAGGLRGANEACK